MSVSRIDVVLPNAASRYLQLQHETDLKVCQVLESKNVRCSFTSIKGAIDFFFFNFRSADFLWFSLNYIHSFHSANCMYTSEPQIAWGLNEICILFSYMGLLYTYVQFQYESSFC